MNLISRWSVGLLLLVVTAPAMAQHPQSLAYEREDRARKVSALDMPARTVVHDVLLRDALTTLNERSGVPVSFSPSRMPATARVSCDCETATVREVLQRLLDRTGFAYREIDGHVLVYDPPRSVPQLDPAGQGMVGALATVPRSGSLPLPNLRLPSATGEMVVQVQGTITGTVRDAQTQQPMAAVQVLVEGTQIGAVTGTDGTFRLTGVPAGTHTVLASRLGFHLARQEVTVTSGGTATVNLSLTQSALALDELVVVGYGTQVAANVTGAVSRANPQDVTRVSTPTVTQSLQGHLPGVFIKNLQAQPGRQRTNINIRGFGEPLLIVDGHPVELYVFNELHPDDIEDIVVLRDAAAAAVYGARAGNGVILVQTRRGTLAAPAFTYRSEFSRQSFVQNAIAQPAEAHEYMQLYNIRNEGRGESPRFSSALVQNHLQCRTASPSDASCAAYPNTNLMTAIFRDAAPQQQHSLSVRGGSDMARYFVSGSWFDQAGMLRSDQINYDRYSVRSNLDLSLTSRLVLELDLSATSREYLGPYNQIEGEGFTIVGDQLNDDPIMYRIYRWRPFWSGPDWSYHRALDPSFDPGGRLEGGGGGASSNPWNYMWMENGGFREYTDQTAQANVSASYELPYGFRLQGRGTLLRNALDYQFYQRRLEEFNYDSQTQEFTLVRTPNPFTSLRQRRDREDRMVVNAQLSNTSQFGRHTVGGLMILEQDFQQFNRVEAWRLNYPVDIPQLFAGPADQQFTDGSAREGGRESVVGRLNYAYDRRYSTEFSFRYDGSSVFPAESRWGFFPSISAAWNISNEAFMQNTPALGFVNALRLRGSYGRLGYDRAGDFQHLATYSFQNTYQLYTPGSLSRGLRANQIPNPLITWEKLDLANVGINFELWNGILGGEFDVFHRSRNDVLGTRAVILPHMIGATLPQENLNEFVNYGWDAGLTHAYRVGPVSYRLGGVLSLARQRTKYTSACDTEWGNRELERRGNPCADHMWSNSIFRLPSDGLFTSQEEIDNWADIDGRNNASIIPGSIRFIDRNGDGRITLEDAIIVGTGDAMPKFTFGLNGGATWRGFDLYMMWQGAGGYGHDLLSTMGQAVVPFGSDVNPIKTMVTNSYVPDQANARWMSQQWMPANTNAKYPCFCAQGGAGVPNTTYGGIGGGDIGRPDFWWTTGDYIRLRNLALAYRLPRDLIGRVGLDNARVQISGYNLFTFYHLDWMDPEHDTTSSGLRDRLANTPGEGRFTANSFNVHPQMRSYNLGIEVNF
jgi:TonB-linked SusC/RagA family outer membrane protein